MTEARPRRLPCDRPRAAPTRGAAMQITLIDFMSLDGVVQAPGGSEEDTDSGFAHGGWAAAAFDGGGTGAGSLQAPGGSEEDPDSVFAHGGWSAPYFDVEVMGPAIFEALNAADALLFGRR